ncbi:MAG: VacJ family lipoprotein [Comamonadaceae bacterium]|nr:MAG: VacJ family lipoprotein [Comamonadaceae bacterium]
MNTNRNAARRAAASLLVVAGLSLLGGCASVAQRHPGDPWEPMNRTVLQFNEALDSALLRPVATVYKDKVPPLIRTGVSNFFGNLGDMWSFVNSALQGKVQDASDNFARVQVNTVWGVFGIFDVASELNIDRHREDFGQTLGAWGVGAGPYLMLPVFGPSTLRDTLALPIDRRFDLASFIDPSSTRYSVYTLRAVSQRANLLRVGTVLEEAALDKYAFIRDAHLQRRRAEIYAPDDPRADVPPRLPPDAATQAAPPPQANPTGQPVPAPSR